MLLRPTVYECLSKRGNYSKSYTNHFLKESLRVSSHGLQMHGKIWICTIFAEKNADFPADVTLLKCDFGSNLQPYNTNILNLFFYCNYFLIF